MAWTIYDQESAETFQVGSQAEADGYVRREPGRYLLTVNDDPVVNPRPPRFSDPYTYGTTARAGKVTNSPKPTPEAIPVQRREVPGGPLVWFWNPKPSDPEVIINTQDGRFRIGPTLPAGWTANRGGSANYSGPDPRYTGQPPWGEMSLQAWTPPKAGCLIPLVGRLLTNPRRS